MTGPARWEVGCRLKDHCIIFPMLPTSTMRCGRSHRRWARDRRTGMRIVAALGGNALLQRGEPPEHDIQETHIRKAVAALAPLARPGTAERAAWLPGHLPGQPDPGQRRGPGVRQSLKAGRARLRRPAGTPAR